LRARFIQPFIRDQWFATVPLSGSLVAAVGKKEESMKGMTMSTFTGNELNEIAAR
jgi:hypothetical protein